MAGLVPAIHAFFLRLGKKGVDARDNPGSSPGTGMTTEGRTAIVEGNDK